jgi:5-methylcytosine-specific restriction enzyme A
MRKITNEIVEKAYDVAKKFFQEEITLKKAIEILSQNGMNENSALDYVYNYSNLIQGKLFTRTTNTYGTDYYLRKIYEENGQSGLQNALISLSQHLDYYEEKSGSSVKQRRDIYNKYLKLLDNKPEITVYADEVDKNLKYAEGKTKTVLVNSYERNQVARQKCIDHYGAFRQVCNFDFEKYYGDIGKDFIHVHHVVDISIIGNEYSVDPIKDLIPVCPNCHSMLHKKKPAFSIKELKDRMKKYIATNSM